MATDKQLDILHDHYKETFARIQEAEKSRNRLLLWVIGLFALLSLEIGYPAAVGGTLGTATVAGAEIHLQALPLPALLDITWALTLLVATRYCQVTVLIHRQYPYLHRLEETISGLLRFAHIHESNNSPQAEPLHQVIYMRESTVYLADYPLLLDVVWLAYIIVFPVLVIIATIWLVYTAWTRLPYPRGHLIIDSAIALALILLFLVYRIGAGVVLKYRGLHKRLTEWQTRRRRRKQQKGNTSDRPQSPEVPAPAQIGPPAEQP